MDRWGGCLKRIWSAEELETVYHPTYGDDRCDPVFEPWNPGPVPPIMDETIQLLGRCAIPIGILLIGATICDQFKEFQLFKNWGCILNACWLRLALIPAMALGLAALIPLSVELRQTLAVEMAMPSAVFPIILCRQYGADSVTAIRVAIGTSLVSWMTIPLWIPWGLKWLGVE